MPDDKIILTFPDGAQKEFAPGVTGFDVAASIGKRLAADALAVKIDGVMTDLMRPIMKSAKFTVVTPRSRDGKLDADALWLIRHTAEHIMTEAICRLWPETKLVYGPPVDDGYFGDIDLDAKKISIDDFPKIEAEMAKIIAENRPMTRYELSRAEALKELEAEGNPYKVENAQRAEGEVISYYVTGKKTIHESHDSTVVMVANAPLPGDTPVAVMPGNLRDAVVAIANYLSNFLWRLDTLDPEGASKFNIKRRTIEQLLPSFSASLPREFDINGIQAALVLLRDQPQDYREVKDVFKKAAEMLWNWLPFEDLCMGPHVPNTGRIGAFKLTAVAGAYFHGDEKQKQLQRIYGTAFATQKDLDEHLARIEEAKKRDHRLIGKQMGLFTMSPLVGQGLILWMPKGATIRTELQTLMQGELVKRGYSPVFTPHIGSVELYKTSGHFPYYSDSQYPTLKSKKEEGKEQEEYLLKPMNCPHHIQIFAAEQHSYRDLPVRLAEFGTVYRYEQSGELNGMTRVRGLTQDDAHLFCTPEQVEAEFVSTVELVKHIFQALGLNDYRVQVSLRDPKSDKYTGDPKNWDLAEETLKRVAKDMRLPHEAVEGEAAFYGPKLDFMVKDCIGREWQLGTVQLDYNLPERFKLEYIGADNARHRPVMIHRAPFGSFERFVGILIEHFAGAFPLWLSPVQVRVANITEASIDAARRTVAALREAGLRVEEDIAAAGNIKQKVKDSEEAKVPYLLVIGDREATAGTVSVRGRGRKDLGVMPLAEFIARAAQEIRERSISA